MKQKDQEDQDPEEEEMEQEEQEKQEKREKEEETETEEPEEAEKVMEETEKEVEEAEEPEESEEETGEEEGKTEETGEETETGEERKLSRQKVSRETLYIIAAITLILIAVNIYIYITPDLQQACYQDLCFYSEQEPVQHMGRLLEGSNKAYLVFEGDVERTERTGKISESAAQFAVMLGPRLTHENIHGIGIRNNEPIECGEKTVEYCKTLEPGENELLLYIEYPDHPEDINEVYIENRTVTIKTKSAENLLAVTRFIDQKFILENL